MKRIIFRIREYESFVAEKNIYGYHSLPQHVFIKLEDFILSSHRNDGEALELMDISFRKGIGKIITARNYVGIITLDNGITIEILPKINSAIEDDKYANRTKQLLLAMLKKQCKLPFKCLQTASIATDKMPVLEIFIKEFLEETFIIVKRGLKRNYELVEENSMMIKGKILFSQHVKLNSWHKERCYVEFDSFSVNCPENRLIKTALLYLYKIVVSLKNRNNIKTLLNLLSDVQISKNYNDDFLKCTFDRSTKEYSNVVLWSKIFLDSKSFTSFAGSENIWALLFPMQLLFERYVATILKKLATDRGFKVIIQDTTYNLFDEPLKNFLLKPDIVLIRELDNIVIVLDTKWKLLDVNKKNYGITQADMYQMFAYLKKYKAKKVVVIYPKTEKIATNNIQFKSNDKTIVEIYFVDLFVASKSINDLIDDII